MAGRKTEARHTKGTEVDRTGLNKCRRAGEARLVCHGSQYPPSAVSELTDNANTKRFCHGDALPCSRGN
jgi:hypothetical protein